MASFGTFFEIDRVIARKHPRSTDSDALRAAGVAHDICNYLQAVSSAVGIIERSMDADARNALDHVVRGAHGALERASRLSRQVAAERSPCRAPTAATSIERRLAKLEPAILLAAGPGVTVTFDYGEDIPSVLCDGNAFDDALMNLVVNATRAMPGGGSLAIALRRDPNGLAGLPAVSVQVADTGCGMDEAIVASAFVPGFSTKSGGRAGAGLGLATVYAFARSAGGTAHIESEHGVGTVVSILLPAVLKRVRAPSRQS